MKKETLEGYRDKMIELRSIDRMLERVNGKLYAPVSARRDGMPRSQSQSGDELRDERVAEKRRVRKVYTKKRAVLANELLAIEQAIDILPSRERTVVRMHYLEGMTAERIGEEIHYSTRQVERILAAAIRRLCS